MALNKYKIGNLIEQYKKKCGINNLTPYDISGINREKEFFEPSNQVGSDTSNYKEVPINYFACNLMHVGRDVVLPIAFNNTDRTKYVSPAYTIFKIIDNNIILNEYLIMLLKSSEKDRLFWFHTDASVRDGMSYEDFCDIELELPPISIQKKYVNIYESMLKNKRCYENGLEDLKLTVDGYIENLRKRSSLCKIGNYIERMNERNNLNNITDVEGVENSQKFIAPKTCSKNITNYKIVKNNCFAYNPSRINIGSIALRKGNDCVVSPMYEVFKIKDEEQVLPEYLMIWLSRREFFRSTLYYATGSVRDTFSFDLMEEVKIPIPNINIQKDIVNIYKCFVRRKQIAEQLNENLKKISPILIRGAIMEACK